MVRGGKACRCPLRRTATASWKTSSTRW
jgi:hypothetical protein